MRERQVKNVVQYQQKLVCSICTICTPRSSDPEVEQFGYINGQRKGQKMIDLALLCYGSVMLSHRRVSTDSFENMNQPINTLLSFR